MSNEQTSNSGGIHAELRNLLQITLQTAQSGLQGGQAFLPGSIALGCDGKYRLAVATVGGTEGSNQLLAGLQRQAEVGDITAAVMYRDVRVRPAGASQDVDAIHALLEDARGQALQAFQLYRKDAAGEWAFDQVEVELGTRSIFPTAR